MFSETKAYCLSWHFHDLSERFLDREAVLRLYSINTYRNFICIYRPSPEHGRWNFRPCMSYIKTGRNLLSCKPKYLSLILSPPRHKKLFPLSWHGEPYQNLRLLQKLAIRLIGRGHNNSRMPLAGLVYFIYVTALKFYLHFNVDILVSLHNYDDYWPDSCAVMAKVRCGECDGFEDNSHEINVADEYLENSVFSDPHTPTYRSILCNSSWFEMFILFRKSGIITELIRP